MGRVYLIGAGPGAADLLTLRAVRALGAADLVLHDSLVAPEVLEFAPQARKLDVGKRAGRASTDQAFISKLLVRSAKRGAVVARLKGGDPMLFGRAQEEIDACRAAGVPIEVIPGVSVAFAAAAELQASLTRRALSRSVAFVTPATARGADGDQNWADAAAHADTAVIYMGKSEAARIADALIARGVPPTRPALIVESVETPDRVLRAGRLCELAALAQTLGNGPAVVLIGEVFAEAAAAAAPDMERVRA